MAIPTLFLALAVFTATFAAGPPALGAERIQLLDRIVAVVNEEVITQDELDRRLELVKKQLARQGTALPDSEALRRQILERLIMDRIQVQYARQTGLRIDDFQLDRAIAAIAEQNRMTVAQFREVLARDGVDYADFREEIRKEMILARLREREIDSRIAVSEGEIDNFLATQATQITGGEYAVSHILVRVPEQATSGEIQARRARAEAALAELKTGKPFAQVAAVYSDAPDALQGGYLGWRPLSRLPELFAEAVVKLNPGEVSDILRSPNGFHILRLEDRRGPGAPAQVTQTRVRHILVRPGETLSEDEARNRLLQLRERIVNGADFAELARLHSEDPSASQGGDLGWVSPGDTVPAFERTMESLQPGEVSEPVKTPLGWHLIQVLERRTGDMTKERERVLARQSIKARKADEAYEEWLRQLRDQAYVEVRLEG
ncbi:peptidylprolyl isomerase [Pelomicrobium sp. G1]|uniref:peptidylprolyl isomerase n=1 Tax=unclassified Pelomicrobium TaxID=2815318 RepID=UPI003F762034